LRSDEDGTATLHIHNALPVDKGQYTVRAVNKAGEAKCFSHVIVKAISTFDTAVNPPTDKVHFEEKLEKPSFTETFPSVVNAYAGESVKFECIVVGKPAPKASTYSPITWQSYFNHVYYITMRWGYTITLNTHYRSVGFLTRSRWVENRSCGLPVAIVRYSPFPKRTPSTAE